MESAQPAAVIDFALIGAPKCGTTSLWHYLNTHPSVALADMKEPRYFTTVRGSLHGGAPDAPPYGGTHHRGGAWYASQYDHALPGQLRGEGSTVYFHAPDAAKRLNEANPASKIVTVLRHPGHRTVSHYFHEQRFDPSLPPLEHLPHLDHPRFRYFRNVSHYEPHLRRWIDTVGRERLLVLTSDQLREGAITETLAHLASFLGIPADGFDPNALTARHNEQASTRSATAARFLAESGGFPTHRLPRWLQLAGRRVKRSLMRMNMNAAGDASPDRSVVAALTPQFEQDVTFVEGILDRDLSEWRGWD